MDSPSPPPPPQPQPVVQPDPNPEFRLPPRPPTSLGRPFIGGPRRPRSWRHPGGTVSETEESEFSDAEAGGGAEDGVNGHVSKGSSKGV